MTVNRVLPTKSNAPGTSAEDYGDQVAEEVEALWRISCEPLANVAGTANAITADTLVSALSAYQTGNMFSFIADATNTSTTVTINIDGLGDKRIKKEDGTDPSESQINAGTTYLIQYDGTDFRLLNAKGVTFDSIFEVEPVSDQNTMTVTGLSNYQDIELSWAVRVQGMPTTVNVQCRASGGTWRTVAEYVCGSGSSEINNNEQIGWLKVVNFGRSNNIKLAFGGVFAAEWSTGAQQDRSDATAKNEKDYGDMTSIGGASTFTEVFDEVRLISDTENFAGTNANQRAYLRVTGL